MTDFVHWTMVYSNPRNYAEFKRAEKELKKVYNKYGTVDLSLIKELIK